MKLQIETKFNKDLLSIINSEASNKSMIRQVTWSKEAFSIYLHDKTLNRKNSPRVLERELIGNCGGKELKGVNYVVELKKEAKKVESFLSAIEEMKDDIINSLPQRIEAYVEVKHFSSIRAVLYPLGNDGGFSLLPKVVYLNTRRFYDNPKGFKDLIVHEVYHARNRKVKYFGKFFINQYLGRDRRLHRIFGWMIEEGIASLMELGVDLSCTDISTVTPLELSKIEGYFQLLQLPITSPSIQKDMTEEIVKATKANRYIVAYVVGYYVAREVYLLKGIEGLNAWTVEHDMKKFMSYYIESCHGKKQATYLEKSIENRMLVNNKKRD